MLGAEADPRAGGDGSVGSEDWEGLFVRGVSGDRESAPLKASCAEIGNSWGTLECLLSSVSLLHSTVGG